jgi:hypothetical protein
MADDAPIACNGFLNIGDQHLAWEPPGRRKPGYWRDVMLKISHSLTVANQRRLVPLFLGDLFDHATNNPETLKTVFLDLASKCWTKPILNVGNHDKAGTNLSPADSLGVIAKSGHVRIIAKSGVAGIYEMAGRRVLVGGTPFGEAIPSSLSGAGGDVDQRIWLTHHDIGFSGSYPGSIDPFSINGCALVLNGHMHLHRAPVDYGNTTWCNFGAITRTAIDAMAEVPSAFEIGFDDKGKFGFLQHELPHKPATDVFNMVGLQISAKSSDELAEDGQERGIEAQSSGSDNIGDVRPSMIFVDMMRNDIGGGVQTRSGAVIRTVIERNLQEWGVNESVQAEITSLIDEVTAAPEPGA